MMRIPECFWSPLGGFATFCALATALHTSEWLANTFPEAVHVLGAYALCFSLIESYVYLAAIVENSRAETAIVENNRTETVTVKYNRVNTRRWYTVHCKACGTYLAGPTVIEPLDSENDLLDDTIRWHSLFCTGYRSYQTYQSPREPRLAITDGREMPAGPVADDASSDRDGDNTRGLNSTSDAAINTGWGWRTRWVDLLSYFVNSPENFR